jgi:hypothetical protein
LKKSQPQGGQIFKYPGKSVEANRKAWRRTGGEEVLKRGSGSPRKTPVDESGGEEGHATVAEAGADEEVMRTWPPHI